MIATLLRRCLLPCCAILECGRQTASDTLFRRRLLGYVLVLCGTANASIHENCCRRGLFIQCGHNGLASAAFEVAQHATSCRRCLWILKGLIQEVSRCIDGRVDEISWDENSLAHGAQDSFSSYNPQNDTDYFDGLVEKISKKRIRQGLKTAHVLNGTTSRSMTRRKAKMLFACQKAAWRTFSKTVGVFVGKEDGARLGKPSKETLIRTVSAPSAGCTFILPPLVSSPLGRLSLPLSLVRSSPDPPGRGGPSPGWLPMGSAAPPHATFMTATVGPTRPRRFSRRFP